MKNKSLLRRVLSWIGWTVLTLFVLLAAVFTYYRLRGPATEQQAALALLHKHYRPEQGVNAFPLLFYAGYDVPDAQIDAQMAAEVEKARRWFPANPMPPSTALYETDAPPLPDLSKDERTALCLPSGKGCLAQVAAHGDAVRAALAAHPRMAGRVQVLERTDFYWDEFPADFRSPLPSGLYGDAQRLWLSALALQYAAGERTGALAATCRNVAAWRRITGRSNSRVGAALTGFTMDGAIRLYADMLAGLPADQAVPEDCVLALQPVSAEDVNRCAQWAKDFAMRESTLHSSTVELAKASWGKRLLDAALFDPRQLRAQWAQGHAAACGDAAVARLLADEHPRREPPRFGLDCLVNLGDCGAANVMAQVYERYDADTLDFAAHLRLAATLLWLREHPGGSIAERFANRPAQLRSPHHESGFDAQHGVLYVQNLRPHGSPQDGWRFELPVAAAR